MFEALAGHERVLCQISREALEDHFCAGGLTKDGRLDLFRKHRREIEGMARIVYLHRPVSADRAVIIRTADVAELRQQLKSRRERRK